MSRYTLLVGGATFLAVDRDEELDSNVIALSSLNKDRCCEQLTTHYSTGSVEWREEFASPEVLNV